MAEAGLGSTTVSKSIRSLVETLRSFEREASVLFERLNLESPESLAAIVARMGKLMSGAGYLSHLRTLAAGNFASKISINGIVGALGLAGAAELNTVRRDLSEFMTQLDQLRDREVLLAGGMRDVRAKAARFDEALTGLARVQGRYQARMGVDRTRSEDTAQTNFERLERAMTALARLQGRGLARIEANDRHHAEMTEMATKRDGHITRLIRDTTVQRTQLERMSEELSRLVQAVEAKAPAQSDDSRVEDAIGRLSKLEASVQVLNGAHKTRRRGQVDSIEAVRERLARVETRAAEISREARAKSGRLDALTRHLASLEGRLANAIGKGGQPVVAVAASVDNPPGAQQ